MELDKSPTVPQVGISTVDRFAGFVVDVVLPTGWEPVDTFDDTGGARVWTWRNDPRVSTFCANAVLVLQQAESVLDPALVFEVLCEVQRQSVRGSREIDRCHANAVEGQGLLGTLLLEIDHEVGTIDSMTLARVLTADRKTLIAQLTVTALHESPVDHGHIRLSVEPEQSPAEMANVSPYGGSPTSAPVGER